MASISWMIAELEMTSESVTFDIKSKSSTNQSILLPEPATNKLVLSRYWVASGVVERRTFSMNPE